MSRSKPFYFSWEFFTEREKHILIADLNHCISWEFVTETEKYFNCNGRKEISCSQFNLYLTLTEVKLTGGSGGKKTAGITVNAISNYRECFIDFLINLCSRNTSRY